MARLSDRQHVDVCKFRDSSRDQADGRGAQNQHETLCIRVPKA